MFDTRSGFWLMASIGILAVLATAAVILFARNDEMTYSSFTAAIGIPMTLVLPIIAILSVTGEWSQRSGLTTFTLVPHRGRVITAKAIACVGVAVVTIPLAFGIGALGNVVGTAIAGVDPVWDVTLTNLLNLVLVNVLGLLVGFMLGVVIRSSAGALVAYFIYQFLLPTLALLLAVSQDWFRDLQPWVDFDFAQGALFDGRSDRSAMDAARGHRRRLAGHPVDGGTLVRAESGSEVAAHRTPLTGRMAKAPMTAQTPATAYSTP